MLRSLRVLTLRILTSTTSFKTPHIPIYRAKSEESTSVKVKLFIYNVKKYGKLNNMDDYKMLKLAECYLQYKAANL